jgi:hypothetical protein
MDGRDKPGHDELMVLRAICIVGAQCGSLRARRSAAKNIEELTGRN